MSCTRYRQLISRYVDDEVTPRQRQELLAHVEHCSDCAAWLARARHTDVLLKSVKNTGPSDSVRQAILSQLHTVAPKVESSKQGTPTTKQNAAVRHSPLRALVSAFLLRFDPSPRRIFLGSATAVIVTVGLLYWLNVLPPVWNYNKLGFEVQDQSDSLSSTPIPIRAVSGNYGADGAMAAPNLTLTEPAAGAQISLLTQPVVIRFDQPMARSSVEDALSIMPPVAGQIAWDADNELRWTPTGTGLLRGITYTVTLSESALSQSGAALPKPATWSFHTSDAHTVTASVPDGASVRPLTSFALR
ncbi:MAG: Ig-like domain-containing protein, partial [Chloroflexota bacterium]